MTTKRKAYRKNFDVAKVQTDSVILNYVCPECDEKCDQPLTAIVENGTLTCDCGTDMQLDKFVDVRTPKPAPKEAKKS